MKLSDTDRQILQHIIRYCDEVLATVEMFGDDKQEFLQNFIYRNAVSMPILQVGELANHLSADFIKAHSDDIPALRQYCCKIIDSLENCL